MDNLFERINNDTKKALREKDSETVSVLRMILAELKNKMIELGEKEDISSLEEGSKVKISGTSKGKGFAGAIKKWGFSGRDATHGVKHEHRTVGSVGSSFPERVLKGRKMPGRMGGERVTVKNLQIAKIDKEKKILMVKGAVPGNKGSLLEIRS